MKKQLLELFTLALSAAAIAAADLTDAEWAQMKQNARDRQRLVIYDNDADDVTYHNGERTIEALMAKRTSWLNKYPVDTIIYCVNGGAFQQLVFPSENGELADYVVPQGEIGPDGKASNTNMVPWLAARGLDMFSLQVEYARANNMEIFAEFRINDTHDSCDSPDNPCYYFSSWKRCHPQFLMGSYENRPPYATWSSYDFTHPEVRDKFVAVVTETAQKFEIDGIFIDLYRWLGLFKSVAWGGVASAEETEMFSEMFRRIRRATEEIGRRRGRPILLAVRVPDSAGYCNAVGFNWEGLMAEGIFDMVFPAGNNHFQPWGKSVELCHKYGVKCYPSIDMPSFNILQRLSRHEVPSYMARIASAYQAGGDGMFYYNLFFESNVRDLMPAGPEPIRLADKRYHISPIMHWTVNNNLATGAEYNELPEMSPGRYSTLFPGHELKFKVEFGDDLAALKAEGIEPRLRATLIADAAPGLVHVSSNGKEWQHIASHEDLHIYLPPEGSLLPGVNEITFSSPAGDGDGGYVPLLTGEYLLQGARQAPWRRLFPVQEQYVVPERIENSSYRLEDAGPGKPSLVYPLAFGSAAAADDELELTFQVRTEAVDDPLAAMLRVACFGKVEFITFSGTQAGFHYADKGADIDTTAFHQYRLRFSASRVILEADGQTLLEAPAVKSTADADAKLEGMAYAIQGMDDSSIIIGSQSDAGKGVSFWKNLRQKRKSGTAVLQDFAIDVTFTPEQTVTAIDEWNAEATEGTYVLGGSYAYQSHDTFGECEVVAAPGGEAKLVLSSGGMYAEAVLKSSALVAGDSQIVPLDETDSPRRVRLEIHDTVATAFVDGQAIQFKAKNVSMTLRDHPEMASFDQATGGAFRNSGMIAIPQGNAEVKALRIAIRP